MTTGVADHGLVHTALVGVSGRTLGEARLTDRARMALVMQAAALLAHLAVARCRLVSNWEHLVVDTDGLLRSAQIVVGCDPVAPSRRLTGLLGLLFGSQNRIVGKGEARRSAARLLRRLQRDPGRWSADSTLSWILDESSYLWLPRYAGPRRALIARVLEPSGERVSVAGRGRFELAVLDRAGHGLTAEAVVSGAQSRDLWTGRKPHTIAGSDRESRSLRGRRLHRLGRWQDSLRELVGLRDPASRLLRADCLGHLGRRRAALKELQEVGDEAGQTSSTALESLDIQVGLLLDHGEVDAAADLLAQRRLATPRSAQRHLDRLAAEVAVRRRDWHRLDRILSAAAAPSDHTISDWRWLRLRFERACALGDRPAAEGFALAMLRDGRKVMPRWQTARLWLHLSKLRRRDGDPRSAEQAAIHALRIFEQIDEDLADEAAVELADQRLATGRLGWARALIEGAAAQDPLARPGQLTQKSVAAVRLDLVLGRPAMVVDRFESYLDEGGRVESPASRRLAILASRALGWLGRGAEAREILQQAGAWASWVLDPEELPPLWAMAGDWQRARESATETPSGRLWQALLSDTAAPTAEWRALEGLGSYRAARLVFDAQILTPGSAPRRWIERAIETLRSTGAACFAERLDRTKVGTWQALESYLAGGSSGVVDLEALFLQAGCFDARLVWRGRHSEQVVVPGSGGGHRLRADKHGGQLELSASVMDPAVRALFALACREFEPAADGGDGLEEVRVEGILGESRAMRRALGRLQRLARSEVPVLILGETGTGKELAARQIHRLSARLDQRLVSINCAALSESLLLSDLFGHVRGAFTGADRDRAGVFESAAGGTVLLDEIGDLPWSAQGKLLRVLQEGEVRRVGESLPRRVDVRVVAATHRDLDAMVKAGKFRADLFYRLGVGTLTLPPLRSRDRDVLLLAEHFAARAGRRLTAGAQRVLHRHSWPGNVRELRNVLQVAVALGDGPQIRAADLELPASEALPAVGGYHRQVEDFRRQLVREALEASNGQRSAAARRLDLSRQALSYLVRRFDLEPR